MNRFVLVLQIVVAVITVPSLAGAAAVSASNQVHFTRGLVREISADRQRAILRHEAIPDYMPAMTMEFNVRNTNELRGISVGDDVAFRLTATDDTHWIDQLKRLGASTNVPAASPAPVKTSPLAELKPGDVVPDYELVSEAGKAVRFSDFRGKAVAFTFIFTRCPLPDFCPRMGDNFARARELLLGATNAPSNWQFLSISFDPDFDQPATLAGYASLYRKDNADRWLFAAAPKPALAQLAPRLDLNVHREPGGSISHNLRTVVLDPHGRIHRQFDGNLWTPPELAQAILEACQQ